MKFEIPDKSRWRWQLVKYWHHVVTDGIVMVANSKHPDDEWESSSLDLDQLRHAIEAGRATPCDESGNPIATRLLYRGIPIEAYTRDQLIEIVIETAGTVERIKAKEAV